MNEFNYEIKFDRANGKAAVTRGSFTPKEKEIAEMNLGNINVRLLPKKIDNGWHFTIDAFEVDGGKNIQHATVMTGEKEGFEILDKNNDATGEEIRNFGFTIVPRTPSKADKSVQAGMSQHGDMVTLNFVEPTPIREIIKSIAQVSGKNLIVSRDVDAKISLVSPSALPKEQVLQTFIAALEKVNIVVTQENDKVIRLARKPAPKN